MRRDRNKDVFAERLARLNASPSKPAPQAPVETPPVRKPAAKPRVNSTVRKIQIWGFVLLMLVVGGVVGNYLYPDFVKTQIAQAKKVGEDMKVVTKVLIPQGSTAINIAGKSSHGLQTPNSVSAPRSAPGPKISKVPEKPQSDDWKATDYVEQTDTGRIIYSPAVLGTQFVKISDLFADYHDFKTSPELKNIRQFQNLDSCTPRRPAAGEKLMGVRLEGAYMAENFTTVDDKQIAGALLQAVKNSSEQRLSLALGQEEGLFEDAALAGQAGDEMKSVDVVITDTSAPIYLVLQTTSGNIIWNLHLSAGVRLAHVTSVANGASGLAGLPAGVSYQVLDVADFVQTDDFGATRLAEGCEIMPWRMPTPDWGIWQRTEQTGSDFAKVRVRKNVSRHATYQAWYEKAFGVPADLNTISAKV
ncbi:MAG: hypothetical protein CSA68_08990, partial [Rhodobacterales bacterium]